MKIVWYKDKKGLYYAMFEDLEDPHNVRTVFSEEVKKDLEELV